MRVVLLFFLCISFFQNGFSQDFKLDYDKLCQGGSEEEILQSLKKWEEAKPDDPEMYIGYFNYYLKLSMKEVIALTDAQPEGEGIAIMDQDDNKTVGYLGSSIQYNDSLFLLSQKYLNDGINKNLDRLDMYFGKIYALGEKKMFLEQSDEIVRVIERAKINKNNWFWANNEKLPNDKKEFKDNIQTYINNLFYEEKPRVEEVKKISKKMLELYPNDVVNTTNIGVAELFMGNLDLALDCFLKAHSVDKKDVIVIGNIAYIYMEKKENQKAIDFYQKLLEYGGEKEKEFATQKIKELSK